MKKTLITSAVLIGFLLGGFPSIDIFATETLKPSLTNQININKQLTKKYMRDMQIAAKRAENLRKIQEKEGVMKVQKSTIPKGTIQVNSTIKINTPTTPTIASYISYGGGGKVENIPGVDMNQVRNTWLGWYNIERGKVGLGSLSFDSRLDITAQSWNEIFSKGKGQNHHERNPGDGYYNFSVISKWFADRGVIGLVKNGTTTVENVGYGYYNCSSSDCTSSLISSIRSTFDFYMREKATNGAHYRSIMGSAFTKVGMSIRVEPSEKRYYLVVHYITEFQ
ncbi:CAP domain-containing protein [Candidatus Gracilibacteria bacterium]|nr:CAP domain-containing protein [Candidatus Gracilibacteria bacterium]